MKKITTLVLIAIGLFVMLFTVGCGEDPQPETERVTEILTSGTWKMQAVSVDGTDRSTIYTGLTINFTATGFNSANGVPVWPASGTWSFTDQTGKVIQRNDGVQITIDEATTAKLVLKLTWTSTTLGTGRLSSVGGQNVFTFGK